MRVLTFGTFDVLHPGHISYLTQAQNLGDELHICVALDSTVLAVKKKKPIQNQDTRKENLKKHFPDAHVHLGDPKNHMKIIEHVKPEIIAIGYDQSSFTDKIEPFLKQKKIHSKIVRLSPFYQNIYKSSILSKKKLK